MSDSMQAVKMTVFRPKRRKNYVMRWTDPKTGRRCEETTETHVKRNAYQIAAAKADKVLEDAAVDDLEWDEFCDLYEKHVIGRRPGRSQEPWQATRRWIDRLCKPRRLSQVTTVWVTRWQQHLREADIRRPKKQPKRKPKTPQPPLPPLHMSENTVASYSARLKAALNWAVKQGYIRSVPTVLVQTEDTPRSRAIVGEEFDRILAAVPKVRPDDTQYWDRFLRGQWHCGFRISEIACLSWDESAPIHIDARGRFPFVAVAAKSNKKRKVRLRAITPEFWAVCQETPPDRRKGLVFPIPNGLGGNLSLKRVVKIIAAIGRRAGVVTNPETGKLATSHDTRRGFAVQMDEKGLTLAELQKWMDHADIRTTLTYYRTVEVDRLAAKLWEASGGASGGASHDSPQEPLMEQG